jgi:hypothetical protein
VRNITRSLNLHRCRARGAITGMGWNFNAGDLQSGANRWLVATGIGVLTYLFALTPQWLAELLPDWLAHPYTRLAMVLVGIWLIAAVLLRRRRPSQNEGREN